VNKKSECNKGFLLNLLLKKLSDMYILIIIPYRNMLIAVNINQVRILM